MQKRPFNFYHVPRTTVSDGIGEFLSSFACTLNAFGHQSDDPTAMCTNRITGDFELIFYRGGTGRVTVSDAEYACGAGDAVLIPPFTLHSIHTTEQDPHDNYWIHFDVQPFHRQGEFADALLQGPGHKLRFDRPQEALALYQRMEEELREGQPGSLAYVHALFQQVVILLLRQSGAAPGGPAHAPREIGLVNASLAFIQSHLHEDIGVEDLCRSLHVGPSSLFKAFASVLRGTPNHLIQLCKMRRAEQLMKSTDLSFKQISQELAFSSPYYFSAVFKKFYHMSPREYLKSIR